MHIGRGLLDIQLWPVKSTCRHGGAKVAMFYIHQVANAIADSPKDATFEDFLARNEFLTDKQLLYEYYSDECINSREAAKTFILPDKKPLRCILE